ncbi:unnamed protein product [Phytophthora lilii]|uniref:Unnamed protein product n=1 Tax=Phytophthora lilii TaxID=2077276 RepID=A0A9W6TMG7_9STRA|nr:unnamed protein product [Phytophthora lilii]
MATVRSGTKGQKTKCALALSRLSENNECKSEIVALDGIPVLIKLLRTGNGAQKECAVSALFILSDNAENQDAIVAGGRIPLVVKLIQLSNEITYAVRALDAFSANEKSQDVTGAADGSIVRLVQLVCGRNGTRKEHAARILMNLSMSSANVVRITRARGIRPLVALLKMDSLSIKSIALGTLANLAKDTKTHDAIGSSDGISECATLVYAGTDDQKLTALAILKEDRLKTAIATPGVTPALVQLISHENNNLKQRAVLVLNDLCPHLDPAAVRIAGGIQPLVTMLRAALMREEEGIEFRREIITRLLGLLLQDPENIEAVAATGVIPDLVSYLRDGTWFEQMFAAQALTSLSLNDANKQEIVSAGGIPPLLELTRSGSAIHKPFAATVYPV